MDKEFFFRIGILCAALLLCYGVVNYFSEVKPLSLHTPLANLVPKQIGKWKSIEDEPMDPKVANILRVDDYVWRKYQDKEGHLIDVYVSYFSYVDRIMTYHSPLNCMPGSGWDIYKVESLPIYLSENKKVYVNSLVLKKGSKDMYALYWYQGRGRVIDTEVKERIYRVIDSVFKRRTNGAFIRIISLTKSLDPEELNKFCANLIDILDKILPS